MPSVALAACAWYAGQRLWRYAQDVRRRRKGRPQSLMVRRLSEGGGMTTQEYKAVSLDAEELTEKIHTSAFLGKPIRPRASAAADLSDDEGEDDTLTFRPPALPRFSDDESEEDSEGEREGEAEGEAEAPLVRVCTTEEDVQEKGGTEGEARAESLREGTDEKAVVGALSIPVVDREATTRMVAMMEAMGSLARRTVQAVEMDEDVFSADEQRTRAAADLQLVHEVVVNEELEETAVHDHEESFLL